MTFILSYSECVANQETKSCIILYSQLAIDLTPFEYILHDSGAALIDGLPLLSNLTVIFLQNKLLTLNVPNWKLFTET